MTSKFTKSLLATAMLTGLLLAGAAGAQTLGGGGSDPQIGAVNARVNSAALADSYRYDAIIVGYNEGDARAAGDAVSAISRHLDQVASRTGETLSYVRTLSTGGHLVKIGKALDDGSLLKVMNDLAADPNVAYVEPDQIMVPFLSPNDSSYSQQWHYFEATGGANLPAAWDNATGSGVVVAVLDTGITSHTDLNANVIAGYDFVSSSTNARDGNGRDSNPADQGDWTTAGQCYSGSPASNSSWHGTHVAGTIAAVTNNAAGVAGVAFNAKIQPVRVLAACGGTLSDIADAITWSSGGTVSGVPANATPAKVINMSLGGSATSCASTYQTAINGAVGRGTSVIVAAGNSNVNVSGATPANCSNVIAVAATNRSGGRAYYSNYGTLVDIAAPGGDVRSASSNGILSTLNSGTTTPGSQSYAWYQGTSMATPHVAGLAALVLSKASQTPAQLETLLKNNARSFPTSCSGCGAGIIDAVATIAAVSGGSNAAPTANFSFTTSGLTASFSDSSSDSDGTIASRSWNFGDGGTSTATNPSRTYASAGTYTVTLTVTDNGGASNSTSRSVTVSAPPTGGSVLSKGVPVNGSTNSTSANSSYVQYTVVVPAGSTNLNIATTNASGDVDLYVRYGSAPSLSAYDCRPYTGSGNETCAFAAPSAGTYYIRVYGYATGTVNFTVTANWTAGGGGTQPSFFENQTNYNINDNSTIESPVSVSGRTGNAPSNLKVAVTIYHTYKGDLKVDLIAPDGSVYVLHNRSGGSGDNIIQTFTVNASSEAANGTWKLRVNDNANGDTGYLDKWSMQF
jgi:serine protease